MQHLAQKKNVDATFVVGQKQNNNQPKEWQFNYVAISICKQFMQRVACKICQSTRAAYAPVSDYLEVFLHGLLLIFRYIDMLFHLHLCALIKKVLLSTTVLIQYCIPTLFIMWYWIKTKYCPINMRKYMKKWNTCFSHFRWQTRAIN